MWDVQVEVPVRLYYTVNADSAEEAVKLVQSGQTISEPFEEYIWDRVHDSDYTAVEDDS